MEAQNTHIWLAPLQRKKSTALFLRTNSKTYTKTITHSLSPPPPPPPPPPPAQFFQRKTPRR